MKIAIVTDTSSGLNNQEVNSEGIYVLPIPYIINGTPYTDNQTYTEFIKEISDGKKFAKTSQVSIGLIDDLYERLLKDYDFIIHFPISSKLSSTVSTCASAAAKYNGKVKILDQLKVAGLLEQDVRHAARLVKEGKTVEEIVEAMKARCNDNMAFIIPFNLTTLKQGGRINAATAAIGNLIGIKPIIQFKDGGLDQYGKERAIIKAYKVCLKELMKHYDSTKHDLMIFHCNEEYRAKEIEKYILQEYESEVTNIKYSLIPVSIVAHTGPGTIGVGFADKI